MLTQAPPASTMKVFCQKAYRAVEPVHAANCESYRSTKSTSSKPATPPQVAPVEIYPSSAFLCSLCSSVFQRFLGLIRSPKLKTRRFRRVLRLESLTTPFARTGCSPAVRCRGVLPADDDSHRPAAVLTAIADARWSGHQRCRFVPKEPRS